MKKIWQPLFICGITLYLSGMLMFFYVYPVMGQAGARLQETDIPPTNTETSTPLPLLPSASEIPATQIQENSATTTPLPTQTSTVLLPTATSTQIPPTSLAPLQPGPGEADVSQLPSLPILAAPKSGSSPLMGSFSCSQTHPMVNALFNETSHEQYRDWVEKLSGAKGVTINGVSHTLGTRYTYAMFSPERANARAFPYVLEQVRQWVSEQQIEIDPFSYAGFTWKNLIVTLPGNTTPQEEIILSAHLDSVSSNPYNNAPGAEDNASGSAALLEAVRIMSSHKYQRTIKIIWFTGEEQGLIGSQSYLNDHSYSNIRGVINLDMFGYDSNNDRCFEMHVGTLPASNQVGQCYADVIRTYGVNLTYDFLTSDSDLGCRSDHCPFLLKGVGAIEILENYSAHSASRGCRGHADHSPYYHTVSDTVNNFNTTLAYDISRAAIAAAAHLAGPLVLISVAPNNTLAGSNDLIISVTGQLFTPSSIVYWNNEALATTYISETELSASIPAAKLTLGGNYPIKVSINSEEMSAAYSFTVINPAPQLHVTSPNSSIPRSEPLTITLDGSTFVPTSKARWNSTELITTFINSEQIQADVPASLLTGSAQAVLSVYSPAPGGGTSTTIPFYIITAPTIIAPKGTVSETNQPEFRWRKVNGASTYYLHLYENSSSSPINQSVTCETELCSHTAPSPLASKTYQYRIKAQSATGWSAWSPWRVFTIAYPPPPPSAPTLLAPPAVVQNPQPELRWRRVQYADAYQVFLDQDSPMSFSAIQARCANSESECRVSPASPLMSGRHTLRVKALRGGRSSPYSRSLSFTIQPPPAAPQLLEPQVQANRIVVYRWLPVQGANRYYLLVYDGQSGRYPLRRYSTCQAQECSYRSPTGLASGSLYRYKVRAYFANTSSPFSEWQNFTVP